MLGYFEGDVSGDSQLVACGNDKSKFVNSTSDQHLHTCMTTNGSWSCGLPEQDVVLEQSKLVALESMWIKLVLVFSETKDGRVLVIPKLDHLHLNGERVSDLDLHVCKSCSPVQQASLLFFFTFIIG